MDFEAIKKAAQGYRADMSRFLRDMISHPSESCQEKEVVMCIKAEMEKLGFDKVEIDGLGNVIGWMGQGEKIIAIDSHIDTVGIGNINNWEADPYKGYETEDVIYGRGGSDQEGGVVSAVYGAKIMKDLGLIPEGYAILVAATVQEEDCDGLCWQYIHNEDGITPEFVVSTEPTDGGIYRGHRGRMEIRVDGAHPLYVYLPCGVGGGPGGVAFGLKLLYGGAVHCYFAEPTHAPCMTLGLATGLHDGICVGDYGIDGKTAADGLAVGRASGLVSRIMDPLLTGCFTVEDARLYRLLGLLADTENIRLEPSALASLPGMSLVGDWAERQGIDLRNAVHIAWATGGSMVPEDIWQEYYSLGA